MAQVPTVTGMLEADELGTTLIHEHLRNSDEAVRNQWPVAGAVKEDKPYEVPPDQVFDIAVREAQAAVDLGVKTIGEPTAMFLGRDVDFMRRVAEQTGLQVIPCTGIYTYDHLPQFFMNRDPDQIADLFVHDIENGIQGTEIKAAFIKCAADEPGVNENIEKIHRAAARASVRTGAAIMAHSRPASNTGTRQIPTTSTTSRACSRRASGSASTATGSSSSCPSRNDSRPQGRCWSGATQAGCSSRRI